MWNRLCFLCSVIVEMEVHLQLQTIPKHGIMKRQIIFCKYFISHLCQGDIKSIPHLQFLHFTLCSPKSNRENIMKYDLNIYYIFVSQRNTRHTICLPVPCNGATMFHSSFSQDIPMSIPSIWNSQGSYFTSYWNKILKQGVNFSLELSTLWQDIVVHCHWQ